MRTTKITEYDFTPPDSGDSSVDKMMGGAIEIFADALEAIDHKHIWLSIHNTLETILMRTFYPERS